MKKPIILKIIKVTITLGILLGIYFFPVTVFIGYYTAYQVNDVRGNPIPDVVINRTVTNSIYAGITEERKFTSDKEVTNEVGGAYFPAVKLKLPLGLFLIKTLLYQYGDPCDCCLPDVSFSIDKKSIKNERNDLIAIDKKLIGGGCVCTVYFYSLNKEWNKEGISWDFINSQRLDQAAFAIISLGSHPAVPTAFWGEFEKLKPSSVSVNDKVIKIRGNGEIGIAYCQDRRHLEQELALGADGELTQTSVKNVYFFEYKKKK